MSTVEDRPTLGERYASAVESSNLKADAARAGDVDLMIAAGWIPDSLGASLYRLQAEFDKCDHRAVKALPMDPLPERIARLAVAPPDEAPAAAAGRQQNLQELSESWAASETRRIAKDLVARKTMTKAMALVQMKSLPAARDQLGRHACIQATKQRFMRPDSEVLTLVGRVLDVFLDPTCHPCEGRGFTGGGRHEQSGPQLICRACKGAGNRQQAFGRGDDERHFGAYLLADMSERMASVERMMRRFLRGDSQ